MQLFVYIIISFAGDTIVIKIIDINTTRVNYFWIKLHIVPRDNHSIIQLSKVARETQ